MAVDKFSVSYYEAFFGYRMPTFKILALFKLVFEDFAQASIQIIYLLFISDSDLDGKKNNIKSGEVTRAQVSLIIIICISLCFAFPSMFSSILTILYNTTSTLKQTDYDQLVKKITISNMIIQERKNADISRNKSSTLLYSASRLDLEESKIYSESKNLRKDDIMSMINEISNPDSRLSSSCGGETPLSGADIMDEYEREIRNTTEQMEEAQGNSKEKEEESKNMDSLIDCT